MPAQLPPRQCGTLHLNAAGLPLLLLQTVLEQGGQFAGINRKAQLKPLRWSAPEEGSGEAPRCVEALLILKHGGVLTHSGRQQVRWCPLLAHAGWLVRWLPLPQPHCRAFIHWLAHIARAFRPPPPAAG